jgi:hypothetical protein
MGTWHMQDKFTKQHQQAFPLSVSIFHFQHSNNTVNTWKEKNEEKERAQ